MSFVVVLLTISDLSIIVRANSEESEMSHYSKEDFHLTDSVGFAISKARNLVIGQMDAAVKGLNMRQLSRGRYQPLVW